MHATDALSALQESSPEWGVTILQAAEELDAGDVWATATFPTHRAFGRPATKSSLYRKECVDAAMVCLREVMQKLDAGTPPQPLSELAAEAKGRLRPIMKQADRQFDWGQSAEAIAVVVAAGDSQPGVLATVAGERVHVFGATVEGACGSNTTVGAPL